MIPSWKNIKISINSEILELMDHSKVTAENISLNLDNVLFIIIFNVPI